MPGLSAKVGLALSGFSFEQDVTRVHVFVKGEAVILGPFLKESLSCSLGLLPAIMYAAAAPQADCSAASARSCATSACWFAALASSTAQSRSDCAGYSAVTEIVAAIVMTSLERSAAWEYWNCHLANKLFNRRFCFDGRTGYIQRNCWQNVSV